MDQTPITLPARSSLLLTANLFKKLGLRYILFATHGQLQGLLTKTDLAHLLSSDNPQDENSLSARADNGVLSQRLLDLDGERSEESDIADAADELLPY